VGTGASPVQAERSSAAAAQARKKSVLHLILGGAAVHRCDKQILYL